MAFYVYLLRCADGTLYGGIATDPKRRLLEHVGGTGAKYTRAHGAKQLERIFLTGDRSTASKIEYAIKHLKKENKERLAAGATLSDVGIGVDCFDCGDGSYAEKLSAAKAFFKKDPLLYVDIAEPIKRGIAVIVEASENGVLAYLPHARYYLFAAENRESAIASAKKMTLDWTTVVVHHDYEREVLSSTYDLFQYEGVVNAVYRKKTPPVIPDSDAVVRPLSKRHLPFVVSSYTLYEAGEELLSDMDRGLLLGAFVQDRPVGFIGVHEEGTMGMLHVLPEYRKKGYGTLLACAQIQNFLSKKFLPYGQIFLSNLPSMELHKKLGFSFSRPSVFWMKKI